MEEKDLNEETKRSTSKSRSKSRSRSRSRSKSKSKSKSESKSRSKSRSRGRKDRGRDRDRDRSGRDRDRRGGSRRSRSRSRSRGRRDRRRDRDRDRSGRDRDRRGGSRRSRSRSRSRGRRDRRRDRSRSRDRGRGRRKNYDSDYSSEDERYERLKKLRMEAAKKQSRFGTGVTPENHCDLHNRIQTLTRTQLAHLGIDAKTERAARRLYLPAIPPNSTEASIKAFFDQVVLSIPDRPYPPTISPVKGVSLVTKDGRFFAFVEFTTLDDCEIAECVDGIIFDGATVSIKRPRDFVPLPGRVIRLMTGSPDTVGKIVGAVLFMSNFPAQMNDSQLKQLVETFGPVNIFTRPAGTAALIFSYQDPHTTQQAIVGLKSIELEGAHPHIELANHQNTLKHIPTNTPLPDHWTIANSTHLINMSANPV